MKNLKKFFAFSIATAMVAGTVWAGTPGFQALAVSTPRFWWDRTTDQYTQVEKTGYTEVWKIQGSTETVDGGKYTVADNTKFSINTSSSNPYVHLGSEAYLDLELNCSDELLKESLGTITWISENSSIATVDGNGRVTGEKVGWVDIYCNVVVNGIPLDNVAKISITVIDDNVDSVSVNNLPPENILYIGQTHQLKATVESTGSSASQDVEWISLDPSVATISNDGTVTARAKGTAIIQAVSKANPTVVSSEKRIDILKPVDSLNIIIPDKIYLSDFTDISSCVELSNDASYEDVKLTSDDSSVIKVENGFISAVGTGDAIITAESIYNQEVKKSKRITVVKRPSSINIIPESSGLYVGETSKLSIIPNPSDAEIPDVTWTSSNPSVLEVKEDGTITGKSSGYYSGPVTITATPKDSRLSVLPAFAYISVTKEGIELSPAEETIYVGGWAYINAIIEHNRDKIEGGRVTWSVDSSDKVYTYHSTDEDSWNDWLAVEGLKPGTAKITATVGSGKEAKSATSVITISSESSKQNATDPNAPTSEERAKQEQTPESIANYQNWLATYGGGDAAAAPVGVTAVSGEVGQPGSEAIVNTGAGEPVAMFQSNDATNTLLAAPVGVVPSGTKIETVEAGKDTPAFKAVQNKLSRISRRGTVQKVYGIAGLNPDGSLMTLINGKAAMSMPMPTDITVPAGRSLKVYLIDDNGQTTKLDTAVDQGRVVFEIPKFGTFAFVVE